MTCLGLLPRAMTKHYNACCKDKQDPHLRELTVQRQTGLCCVSGPQSRATCLHKRRRAHHATGQKAVVYPASFPRNVSSLLYTVEMTLLPEAKHGEPESLILRPVFCSLVFCALESHTTNENFLTESLSSYHSPFICIGKSMKKRLRK